MNDVIYYLNCVIRASGNRCIFVTKCMTLKSLWRKTGFKTNMIDPSYMIAIVLLVGWAVGFLIFHMRNEIHVLLALAMIIGLVNIIREG